MSGPHLPPAGGGSLPSQVDQITPYLEPKPAGGTRVMALLSDRDEHAWQELAEHVSIVIEPRLGPRVLANRCYVGRHSVRPPAFSAELRVARRSATDLARRQPILIRTDVRSFYPSVTPSITFNTLRRLNVERAIATKAAEMLDGWGSEGYEGLPIGPPGSAVLANAVLAGVDADLESRPFLRWVDDYVIGQRDDRAVTEVIERLDASLASLGLERSVAKTSILEGRSGFVWPGTYERP